MPRSLVMMLSSRARCALFTAFLVPLSIAGLAQNPAPVPVPVPLPGLTPVEPPIGAQGLDRTVLHAQVILDKLGFSPGVLDGRSTPLLAAALRGFQDSRGLIVTGQLDGSTLRRLSAYRAWRPLKKVTISAGLIRGPYAGPLPQDMAARARLPALSYRNALEGLAEHFHTTPEMLVALNGRSARLAPGVRLLVPNALPTSRALREEDAAWRATLVLLNVDARQPEAKRILVDESEGVVKVYGPDDRLVAQFPATMGSSQDPLPLGRWIIKGKATNPPFHYNPALFWDADSTDRKAVLPAGPNSPVGVVWIDINKPHYGLHGTPEPHLIGRTESHGCIRLTNWDAARLAQMAAPGMEAVFQR